MENLFPETDTKSSSCTLSLTRESRILRLNKQSLETLMRSNTQLGLNILDILREQTRQAYSKYTQYFQMNTKKEYPAQAILNHTLQTLSQKFGEICEHGTLIPNIVNQDLVVMTGLCRETISRTLDKHPAIRSKRNNPDNIDFSKLPPKSIILTKDFEL